VIALNTEADARVAAAHQRLRVRATTLRADWQKLETAWRNALTTPTMIGSVAVLGAVMGARSRSPVVEHKRVNAPPSFLRLLLVALVTPLLKGAIAGALAPLFAGHGVPAAPAAPSAKAMTPGVAPPDL
jgi:hypothetical protein